MGTMPPEDPKGAGAAAGGVRIDGTEVTVVLVRSDDPEIHQLCALFRGVPIGTFGWDVLTGEVVGVAVQPDFRRRGVASALWHRACALHAEDPDVFPTPQHSAERSAEGDAWARAIGGDLPALMSAVDLGLDSIADLRS